MDIFSYPFSAKKQMTLWQIAINIKFYRFSSNMVCRFIWEIPHLGNTSLGIAVDKFKKISDRVMALDNIRKSVYCPVTPFLFGIWSDVTELIEGR